MSYTLEIQKIKLERSELNDQGIALRQFVPDDLLQVIEINRICLPENYNSTFFLDIHRNLPDAFIVAEANGKVVGYIMCRLEHGLSETRRFNFVKKGHIVSVAVLPEHRRTGIGSALATEALKALSKHKAGECFLEVRVTNEPAINLYKKLGFSIARKASHYYFDGADAYVMSFRIPPESSNAG